MKSGLRPYGKWPNGAPDFKGIPSNNPFFMGGISSVSSLNSRQESDRLEIQQLWQGLEAGQLRDGCTGQSFGRLSGTVYPYR
ncbi:MAG: hypothetical protein Kow006_07740 [Gammaproteobacteria bacterium]